MANVVGFFFSLQEGMKKTGNVCINVTFRHVRATAVAMKEK